MNFTCSSYKSPSLQSPTYSGGVLFINGKPFTTVSASLYLSHRSGYCNVIDNFKNASYERYLHKKKYKI